MRPVWPVVTDGPFGARAWTVRKPARTVSQQISQPRLSAQPGLGATDSLKSFSL
ncbi:hypothetical protein [Nitrospira lenta]|uniref:Uncharacterized protein n=1 Tax=Nitrospira lenta TaxID=1436998 RepID=A0A330LBE2_9BACT|nr:hypothetical protein [Nitrospira lenta]SPP66237.1 hypothetical protein NITLEN_60040 [Nitrospira lenta]